MNERSIADVAGPLFIVGFFIWGYYALGRLNNRTSDRQEKRESDRDILDRMEVQFS